jgi:hypothetical protein
MEQVYCEKFGKMLFQATGLIGFIAMNIPTGQRHFEFLGENIEHENGMTVFIFRLFGGFAIDGGNKRGVMKNGVKKLGKGRLEMAVGEFSPNTGEGIIAGNPCFALDCSEGEKGFQCFEVLFCPACDFGGSADVGEEPEKSHGEDCGKRMGNAAFRTRIGNWVETVNKVGQGLILDWGHVRLLA